MENESVSATPAGEGNNRTKSATFVVYFALGFFAVFTCNRFFGVLTLSLFGAQSGYLFYSIGAIACAVGVTLSLPIGNLLKKQSRLAKLFLFASYPTAALLVCAAAVAPANLVWVYSLFLPFCLLEGLNAGLCTRFLCKANALAVMAAKTEGKSPATPTSGGAGRLLGVSICMGFVVYYLVSFIFPPGSPFTLFASGASLVLALFGMMYCAVRKLDIPELLDFAGASADARKKDKLQSDQSNVPYHRYLYALCSTCGAIAILSYMIGVSDATVYTSLFTTITSDVAPSSASPMLFHSQLLYIPGLLIAGALADWRRGKFLPISILGCTLLLIPVIALVSQPETYIAFSGITYFVGGFFFVYILMSVNTIAHHSRHPERDVPLAGFLFFLFSGLGAFFSKLFLGGDFYFSLAAFAVCIFCLLFAFFLSGSLQAVSPYEKPEELNATAFADERRLEETASAYGITERETDVLRLLVAGKSTTDIASEIFITEKTVQKYITSMLAKTEAESRVKLVTLFMHVKS